VLNKTPSIVGAKYYPNYIFNCHFRGTNPELFTLLKQLPPQILSQNTHGFFMRSALFTDCKLKWQQQCERPEEQQYPSEEL